MKTERDTFLTEAMGNCYHENVFGMHYTEYSGKYPDHVAKCTKCGEFSKHNTNFSTWQGFGILWEWVQEQSWREHFLWKRDPFRTTLPRRGYGPPCTFYEFTHDKLADMLYEYLKERKCD